MNEAERLSYTVRLTWKTSQTWTLKPRNSVSVNTNDVKIDMTYTHNVDLFNKFHSMKAKELL